MNKRIYEIDGGNFSTLYEFWEEISGKLIPGAEWGRSLDAFNGSHRVKSFSLQIA